MHLAAVGFKIKKFMSCPLLFRGPVLLLLLQHKEIIPLLRHHGASDFPLKTILHAVAADVTAQKEQPGLLQHVLGHIRAWVNEARARGLAGDDTIPAPNLRDCGAWLPGVGLPEQEAKPHKAETADAAPAAAAPLEPPTKDPQLIEAIGEVAKEYNDQPAAEDEDAARGWDSLAEPPVACI